MYPARQDTEVVTHEDISGSLVTELAMRIESPSEVFARHGYSEEQAAELLASSYFQAALKSAHEEWRSASNTEERVRLKSLIALEEMLPHQYAMGIDPDVSPAVRNETAKFFRQTAGMDKRDADVGSGNLFSLTMNFGGKEEKVVISQDVIDVKD